MIWRIEDKDDYILYVDCHTDLKIRVVSHKESDEVHINYKGYNLTWVMLIWEFREYLSVTSIKDFRLGGKDFNRYFIIDKSDRDEFLDEVYFFLVDNDMSNVLDEDYRATWSE